MKIQKIITCNRGNEIIIPYPSSDDCLHLSGLDLRGCDFSNLNLAGSEFTNCNLDDATFENSQLGNCVIKESCSLVNTDFTGAYIENVKSDCFTSEDKIKWYYMLYKAKYIKDDTEFTKKMDALVDNKEVQKVRLILDQLCLKYAGNTFSENWLLFKKTVELYNEQTDRMRTIGRIVFGSGALFLGIAIIQIFNSQL